MTNPEIATKIEARIEQPIADNYPTPWVNFELWLNTPDQHNPVRASMEKTIRDSFPTLTREELELGINGPTVRSLISAIAGLRMKVADLSEEKNEAKREMYRYRYQVKDLMRCIGHLQITHPPKEKKRRLRFK